MKKSISNAAYICMALGYSLNNNKSLKKPSIVDIRYQDIVDTALSIVLWSVSV